MNNYSRRSVGVVGSRGYSGAELLRILRRHPSVDPVLLEHRADSDETSGPLGQKPLETIPATAEAVRNEKLELVFLATPPGPSVELAPSMLEAGAKVIDFSGAFRLRDEETFSRWYKERHTAPALSALAEYRGSEAQREC